MKTETRQLLLIAVLSTIAAVSFYFPFLHNFFDYDDFKYLENFFVSPLAVVLGYGNLRVISNLAWWPLFSISGAEPFVFNLFAVLLHAANATLLYLVLRRLLQKSALPIVGMLLFLSGSVACDALFWKAASNTLIATFFYLITLWLYLVYRQSGSRRFFAASIAAFTLAIFSKEDAASMPFILVALELLYFDGLKNWKQTLARIAPFIALILLYIVAGKVLFDLALQMPIEHQKFFKIRPLYSLLACWTVFFLPADGHLTLTDPRIFATALLIPLSFFWVKDRRVLLLGYVWIFFAFLPQSFTSLGQLEPKYLFNSVSRYLYIPSIGASIVLAAALLRAREMVSKKAFAAIATVFLFAFVLSNYSRLHTRGMMWKEDAEPMAQFLRAMKEALPVLPSNSYVHVVNASAENGYVEKQLPGRAYIQQGLRAYYGNPRITWLTDPTTYLNYPREYVFLLICHWRPDGGVDLQFM